MTQPNITPTIAPNYVHNDGISASSLSDGRVWINNHLLNSVGFAVTHHILYGTFPRHMMTTHMDRARGAFYVTLLLCSDDERQWDSVHLIQYTGSPTGSPTSRYPWYSWTPSPIVAYGRYKDVFTVSFISELEVKVRILTEAENPARFNTGGKE